MKKFKKKIEKNQKIRKIKKNMFREIMKIRNKNLNCKLQKRNKIFKKLFLNRKNNKKMKK